jgi:Arc/MetJ-type ribon-helix-helix transcriptional regulator
MKTISLRLPESLDTQLTAAARQRGITRSALVREALQVYLSGGGAAEPSAYDLVSDLLGSVEGPGDLSTDKARMEGYGR